MRGHRASLRQREIDSSSLLLNLDRAFRSTGSNLTSYLKECCRRKCMLALESYATDVRSAGVMSPNAYTPLRFYQ